MSSSAHYSLEKYFKTFRDHIIGIDQHFDSVNGDKRIVYADWTASGRLYRPIEEKLMNDFGPFVANTHTETSITGTMMTMAYHKARKIIKEHVGADKNDVIISFKKGNEVEMKQFFHSDDWGILCEDIERRQLAVLMAAQTRLGQKSVLATLNGDLIREIARISVS